MLMKKDNLISKPTSYQIGIIFCLWRYNKKHNRITFTSSNRYFLEQIENLFISSIEMYKSLSNVTRYKINIYPSKELLNVFNIDSNNIPEKVTNIPENIDLKEFFKAYLELNANFQIYKRNRKGYSESKHRLRIIGRESLLNSINSYLEDQKIAQKKTMTHVASKAENTYAISYSKKDEVLGIYNFFYTEPCNEEYWNKLKQNIENVYKE